MTAQTNDPREPTDKMLARLLVVNEVSAAALEHPSRGGVLRVVADSIVRHFSYFEVSVFELDEEAAEVVLRAQSPPRDLGTGPPYRQSISDGLLGVAVREARSVLVNDVATDPRYIPPPDGLPQPAAELCVPIFKSGRVAGVIDVESQEKNAFGEGDRVALEAIANMVGLALRAAEYHEELERQLEELREAQCQLVHSERLAVVGRLTSRVAHEIRNPLSTIGGFAHRIARRADLDEKAREYAQIIVEEVKRLEHLLAGIMNFARPGLPHKQPTNLNALVERSLSLCEDARKGKQIRIRKDLDPAMPPIQADPGQLEQVFINVLRNAFDAIEDTGEVSILTERSGHHAVVRISDTGGGIEPEVLAHIFDPFFSTKEGGTGLGLAVASKIVEDHDGHIIIGSEPGRGTHVSIRIPLGTPTGAPGET